MTMTPKLESQQDSRGAWGGAGWGRRQAHGFRKVEHRHRGAASGALSEGQAQISRSGTDFAQSADLRVVEKADLFLDFAILVHYPQKNH